MYKVFLVDDEPASIELMKKIIQLKCTDFKVTGTASGAGRCLAAFKESGADVLITDIKMPEMDGISLIGKLKEICPDIIAVVVSGYQEFEYAKAVLKLNVIDYLLKPIVPSEMAEVMQKVKIRADRLFKEKRAEILGAENEAGDSEIEKYFTHKRYDCILVRKNGLPGRFPKNEMTKIKEDMNEMIFMGRDAMETLYIFPCGIVGENEKENVLPRIQEREKKDAGYVTLIYSGTPVLAVELQKTVKELYQCMDSRLVNGVSQMINMKNGCGQKQLNIRQLFRHFEQLLEARRLKQAREELLRLGTYLEHMKTAQAELERIIDYTVILSKDYMDGYTRDKGSTLAFEDIFLSGAGIREIIAELAAVIFYNVKDSEAEKMDTAEFFSSIIHYMHIHIGENLSLKSIGHEFGISQTYLGKLFRKYKNQSFSAYLIEIRLEKAKQLLLTEEGILIKDAAKRCGYHDQFYFSRLFHSYTGLSPTEFIASGAEADFKNHQAF